MCKNEWSGHPDPNDPDNYWIDDETGERVNAETGERASQKVYHRHVQEIPKHLLDVHWDKWGNLYPNAPYRFCALCNCVPTEMLGTHTPSQE